jgi:hypothetical protein
MEFIYGPIAALLLSLGYTQLVIKRIDEKANDHQARIEVLETKALEDDPATTRKIVTAMMPVVQAVKSLQDTVGVK